jgi:hypothetical protein
VRGWSREARELLPGLGEGVRVRLELDPSSRLLIPDHGVGGFAATPELIVVAFDPTAGVERAEHLRRLRGAVYHESFHVANGFVASAFRGRELSALHNAAYEGAATVFERDRAGSKPPWGVYFDDETMSGWAAELAALPLDYEEFRWKFWDEERKQSWIVYRVGTYLVDRALRRNPDVAIEDLAARAPADVLSLAGLP